MSKKQISLITLIAFFLNTVVSVAPVFADSGSSESQEFLHQVKTLQANVDSGKMKFADAVDAFSASLVKENVSMNSIDTLAQSTMTAQQFQAYKKHMDSALHGINPETLSPQEVGSLVGNVIAQTRTEGLYWNGCATMYTGVAIAVAAITVGFISISKIYASNKIASIRATAQASIDSYNQKIANNDASYNSTIQSWETSKATAEGAIEAGTNQQIVAVQNWQSNYPTTISQLQAKLSTLQSEVSSVSTTSQLAYLQGQINTTSASLQNYQSKVTLYTNDPSQVAADIAAIRNSGKQSIAQTEASYNSTISSYEQQRDQADAGWRTSIDQQNSYVADQAAKASNDGDIGLKLGIGAGIGAAVSAGLIVVGAHYGSSCTD